MKKKKSTRLGLLMTGAPAETKDNSGRENEREMEGGRGLVLGTRGR